MSNNIKILFWLYKARANKQGEAPLMLRVTHNGERAQIHTGLALLSSKWDNGKCKAKGKDQLSEEINKYIHTSTTKLSSLFTEMNEAGDVYLPTLFSKFLGKDICRVKYHVRTIRGTLY
jgi:hypothetical protein